MVDIDYYRLLSIISSSIKYAWGIFIVPKISLCTKLNPTAQGAFPCPTSKAWENRPGDEVVQN